MTGACEFVLCLRSRRQAGWLPASLGLLLLAAYLVPSTAQATVVVLANQTPAAVSVAVDSPNGKRTPYEIAAGDARPIPAFAPLRVSFKNGESRSDYVLKPDSIYFFSRYDGKLDLHEAAFSTSPAREPPASQDAAAAPAASPPLPVGGVESFFRMGVIPVRILVDDEEAAARPVWEERLRQRVKEASDVIEPYCRIRFRVVDTGTWDSDDGNATFSEALREFETKVDASPAALAIGFTSQYAEPVGGRGRLGGIRGPLQRHLLVREGSPRVSKAERLELLVHELGHYLGAVHCPDKESVMRPILADGRARAADFPLRFDAVNVLIVYLVGSEIRTRGIRTLSQISPATKQTLKSVYGAVDKAFPEDGVAGSHLDMLGVDRATAPRPGTLAAATRTVVLAVVQAAESAADDPADPVQAVASDDEKPAVRGDQLTELYCRRAAAAAQTVSDELAERAFLLGLALALDDSTILRDRPLVGDFCRQVESDSERAHRLKVLGSPTMRGRRDLAQHFVVSCGLTVMVGAGPAEAIGLTKELRDSLHGSGFSFADLMADMAGIAFAGNVVSGRVGLDDLGQSFRVNNVLPDHQDLSEGISWTDFVRRYGSTRDERFLREKAVLEERIQSLVGPQGP